MPSDIKIKKAVTNCSFSLAEAIQQAGGTVSDRMLDMTVREFIADVAGQNGIRFVHKSNTILKEPGEGDTKIEDSEDRGQPYQ